MEYGICSNLNLCVWYMIIKIWFQNKLIVIFLKVRVVFQFLIVMCLGIIWLKEKNIVCKFLFDNGDCIKFKSFYIIRESIQILGEIFVKCIINEVLILIIFKK